MTMPPEGGAPPEPTLTSGPYQCGTHRAFIYERGGEVLVGEITPLHSVRWQRIRDDVSTAEVTARANDCCDLMSDVRAVIHELHIERNGVIVWEGPITRIEYEIDMVRVFAEDVLFVAKRTVLEMGYDQSYPNIGNGIDRMDWLMREQCFAKYGDPWRVVEHLHPLHHADDPRSARVAFAFSMYVWEDFDKYAEDYGTDYTVIGRDIYYFDNHLAWAIIPPLDENYLSQMPRIVEYGYQLATRCTVTNGKGFAGSAVAPAPYTDVDQYGIVDLLISNVSENAADEAPPTAGDLEQWAATAAQNLEDRYPTPVSIVVPANTTLLPGAPWDLDIMIPGAWFIADVTRTCRTVTEWQRLHEVVVTEAAPMGEMVQFTAVSAPSHMVLS